MILRGIGIIIPFPLEQTGAPPNHFIRSFLLIPCNLDVYSDPHTRRSHVYHVNNYTSLVSTPIMLVEVCNRGPAQGLDRCVLLA